MTDVGRGHQSDAGNVKSANDPARRTIGAWQCVSRGHFGLRCGAGSQAEKQSSYRAATGVAGLSPLGHGTSGQICNPPGSNTQIVQLTLVEGCERTIGHAVCAPTAPSCGETGEFHDRWPSRLLIVRRSGAFVRCNISRRIGRLQIRKTPLQNFQNRPAVYAWLDGGKRPVSMFKWYVK